MDWFENWFDSSYYHVLYKKRNTAEARIFLEHILDQITLPKNADILDLACGKGRHSRYLNSLGYKVTGVDLSLNSIEHAQQFASSTLHFEQMDMRHLMFENQFDLVVNMFTSFGYFHNQTDNVSVLKGVSKALKTNGLLVIDFLNAHTVINQLVKQEKQIIEDIEFRINRFVEDGKIIKKIDIIDRQKFLTYKEKVSAFTLTDFKNMFTQSGFKLIGTFGNYQLGPFDKESSNRLILLAQKSN